ncbi:hypothetical protein SAMN05421505_11364 [Sinosporangium album]|uniref:CBM2 domain-containing protein n=2 Tax=Sinosporangium album TaxID=504805 RepID=A0A1G8AZW4_9ACTN|nr:hypothetical protein SAMN05421505_11364 [Sinosporangium album]
MLDVSNDPSQANAAERNWHQTGDFAMPASGTFQQPPPQPGTAPPSADDSRGWPTSGEATQVHGIPRPADPRATQGWPLPPESSETSVLGTQIWPPSSAADQPPGEGAAVPAGDAVPAAEERTGFLASGWSKDDGDSDGGGDEPRRRRRRRRAAAADGDWGDDEPPRRGKAKMALLAGAAAAIVLTGTVLAVNLMSGEGQAAGDCAARGDCAATSPAAPLPEDSSLDGITDEPLAEDSGTPEEPEPEESAAPSATAPAPRRPTAAPAAPERRPTPVKTRQTEGADDPSDEPEPEPEPEPEYSPSESPTEPGVDISHVPAPGPTSAPTHSEPTVGVSGGSMRINYGVVSESSREYTAALVVMNDAKAVLDGWRVSLPVHAEVAQVNGGTWRQQGDTLTIAGSGGLRPGQEYVITFTAYGVQAAPKSCNLAGGECSIG